MPGDMLPVVPLPRMPNQEIPQQYMSPVVMMPQVNPPVVVWAPTKVAPAATIRVNPTTRSVGGAEATGSPLIRDAMVTAVPMVAPTKAAEYVPSWWSTVGRNAPTLVPPCEEKTTVAPPTVSGNPAALRVWSVTGTVSPAKSSGRPTVTSVAAGSTWLSVLLLSSVAPQAWSSSVATPTARPIGKGSERLREMIGCTVAPV